MKNAEDLKYKKLRKKQQNNQKHSSQQNDLL